MKEPNVAMMPVDNKDKGFSERIVVATSPFAEIFADKCPY